MEETRYLLIEFCNCMEQIEQAQQIHDLKSMQFLFEKAELHLIVPEVQDLQRWIISYTKEKYKLFFDDKADKEKSIQELLKLRKKALYKPITAEEHIKSFYECIKKSYVALLWAVLVKDYTEMHLPEYEELCLELLEIMEKEEWKLAEGNEYYLMMHQVTAEYYIRKGKMISGLYYYQKIWEKYKDEEIISSFCFHTLCDYLHNLMFQKNISDAIKVTNFLNKKWYDKQIENCDEEEMENFRYILFYHEIELWGKVGHEETALELTEKFFDKEFFDKKTCDIDVIYLTYIYLTSLEKNNKKCNRKRLKKIKRYLRKMEKNRNFLSDSNKVITYFMIQYSLLKKKKIKKAADYLRQCDSILRDNMLNELSESVFRGEVVFMIDQYKSLGQSDKVLEWADCFMKKTIEFYDVREFYEENKQMEKYFEGCDVSFQYVYYAIKDILSIEKKFIYNLNYKKIFSSVLRLRNQKNAKETSNFYEESDFQELPYFSFEQLKEILPEHTAIIDYIYIEPEIYETNKRFYESPNRKYILDIFILSKKNGICTIEYKSISEAEQLNKKLTLLMDKMKKDQGKMKEFSKEIYRELFLDFESLFQDITQLWICPDRILCNFSFEAFFELANSAMSLCYIVYWQSLRDIFEKWYEEDSSNASCMIGSPEFGKDIHKNLIKEEIEFSPLPYSGYEAVKLAACMNGDYFIGKKAVKSVLKQGYRYIHIATHSFNRDEEKNPWYKSVLAFSGAQDYLREGLEIIGYGNGLLSAEEISKMDFTGTELVVLSACNSGNSFFSDHRQQSGLHVAFGVSGVKYIVSALWEVDDFPTAVFMNYFYENLKKKISVPEALFWAKRMLRKTTVRELRELIIRDREIMPESSAGLLTVLESLPEEYCCYDSVQYWGSFICSQAMR